MKITIDIEAKEIAEHQFVDIITNAINSNLESTVKLGMRIEN